MKLDIEQTTFVDEMINGNTHMVLTGKAGTGKSVALSSAVAAAKNAGKDVLVMAPTAMAASIHRDAGIDSGTIHHALKWNPIKEPLPRKLLALCRLSIDWESAPDQNRILVIDETSMVGLWLFEVLTRELKDEFHRDDIRPFNGRRIVLVGDWAQLPSVWTKTEESIAKGMNELKAFGPPAGCVLYHKLFRLHPPKGFILTQSHRADSSWFDSLNVLRDCNKKMSLTDCGMNLPSQRRSIDDNSVHMCFRRVSAHKRNEECLARLSGREWKVSLRDGLMRLKEGCDVIVTANRANPAYINGSRATFSGITSDGEIILDDENRIRMLADGNWSSHSSVSSNVTNPAKAQEGVDYATRLLTKYHDILEPDGVLWLTQIIKPNGAGTAEKLARGAIRFLPYFPILPGYALTVHKAQGMTLSGVVVEDDVFWSFAPARLPYVALSRVSDESAVALNGFSPNQVRVKPDPAYPSIISRIEAWAQ